MRNCQYGRSRGPAQLRPFPENLRITVIEPQVTIPKAHEVIADDGSFTDQAIAASVRSLAEALVTAMRARATA